MRKFLRTMTSIAMLLGSSIAYAQIPTGDYGNGQDGSPTISSTYYADAQRAKVTDISSNVITISNAQGATIPINDYVLVIQMEGTNVGHYQFERVADNTTANEYTLNNNLSGFTTGAGEAVQVIHVYEFDNLTITTGGVVTCAAWDGNTGGVVCFFDRGKLTITSNGRIDASGKGYQPGSGGSGGAAGDNTSGLSGSGATGNGGNASGSIVSEVGTKGYSIHDGTSCSHPAYQGGSGTDQFPGAAGASGSPGTSWGDPTFLSKMIMGDAGESGDGGKGPGAGGYGGGGAGNGLTAGSTPSIDPPDISLSTGGDGGAGGAGGGAIYIRAGAIDAAGVGVGRSCIFSNGEDGTVGTNGAIGGQGAPGGAGALGQCPAYPAGGAGGIGYRGDGGDGGQGGSGGDAGLMWVTYSGTLINFNGTSFEGIGGYPAAGGSGGGVATKLYSTQLPTIMDLNDPGAGCTYNQSGAYHYCDDTEEEDVCDCDEVFCRMTDMTNTPTGTHDFELDANNYGVWYNPGGGVPSYLKVTAVTTTGGTSTSPALVVTTEYRCKIDDATAKTYVTDIVGDLSSGSIVSSSCTDNGTQMQANFDNGTDDYDYIHVYSSNSYLLYKNSANPATVDPDCSDPQTCPGDCPQTGQMGPTGAYGTNSQSGQLGDDVEMNQETCVTCMVIKTNSDVDERKQPHDIMNPAEETNSANDVMVNQLGVSLYPNPSSTVVNFSFNSLNQADVNIVITDALGKTVIVQDKTAAAGANTFTVDISSLPAGIYIANIKSEGKISQIKFIVQK